MSVNIIRRFPFLSSLPGARAVALFAQRWRTRNPATFNEKIRYKMVRDASPLATMFADKVAVREYVERNVGASVLPARHGLYEHAEAIPWEAFPREFVIKVNRAAGGVIVVADIPNAVSLPPHVRGKTPLGRYVVHPDRLDRGRAARMLQDWLTPSFDKRPGLRTIPAYRPISPRILAEEFLEGPPSHDGRALPAQLMVHCIHGEPAEFVVTRRSSNFKEVGQRRYLPEEWLDGAKRWGIVEAEACQIEQWSRVLAAEADMVRADWHLTRRGLRFNELTNFPAAGKVPFTGHARLEPQQLDRHLGALWRVPARYASRPKPVWR